MVVFAAQAGHTCKDKTTKRKATTLVQYRPTIFFNLRRVKERALRTINRKAVVSMLGNLGMQLSTFAITVPTDDCRFVLFLTVLHAP